MRSPGVCRCRRHQRFRKADEVEIASDEGPAAHAEAMIEFSGIDSVPQRTDRLVVDC